MDFLYIINSYFSLINISFCPLTSGEIYYGTDNRRRSEARHSLPNMFISSPSDLDHQKSVDADQTRLQKIQALKEEYAEKIQMQGDGVPDSWKRSLERVKEQEEVFANRPRLARVTERDIGSFLVSKASHYRGVHISRTKDHE